MKKLIIGALVSALILFIWQFLSFSILDLHGSQMEYIANQDTILEVLEANLEEGEYFLPRVPRGASSEEQEAAMEENIGKPWALVKYRKSFGFSFGMNLFRALIINFISALILCWILMRFAHLDIKKAIMTCVGVGLIGYFTINYLDQIWFKSSSIPDLIDAIVPWALIGVWTGWYLPEEG